METHGMKTLMQKIGYRFQNESVLETALTHSSYANEHQLSRIHNNERLEYLGDAVLELCVSEYLFRTNPQMPEGEMTKLRASIVCEPTLYLCAKNISLGSYLHLGKGEEATGGRERASVVSDAMEAVIGAIYLDGGFEGAKAFIYRFILDDLDNIQLFSDSKTVLQEMIQSEYHEGELFYELVKEEGPDHNKTFVVHAMLGNQLLGEGSGRTKKAAEQEAAYNAILNRKSEKGV